MRIVASTSDEATRARSGERFGELLGRSPRMRELFAELWRIAQTDVSLLIEGETGTGKDLVAASVHNASPRAGGPYVIFHCRAVAPTHAELERAKGGSLFLDEIDELPLDLQLELLGVLELPHDVRLLAATSRNLAGEVQRGTFREDLYRRVASAHVQVPPLRERMEDLPLLIEHFAALHDDSYRWPGNVRELSNAVQRVLMTPDSCPPSSAARPRRQVNEVQPLRVARRDAAESFELDYLRALLTKTSGNVTRAAAIAEVSRQMIQKLMRKRGL